MTTLLIVIFSALTVAVLAALVTAPWWFVSSLYRHRLWRLHDRLLIDVVDGRLPAKHPAVRQLRRRLGYAVDKRRRLTMLDVLLVLVVRKTTPPEVRGYIERETRDCSLDGLSPDQRDTVMAYRQSSATLLTGRVLTGSWLGLLVLMFMLPVAVIAVSRQERAEGDRSASLSDVADRAVERTHLVKPTSAVALSRQYQRRQHAFAHAA